MKAHIECQTVKLTCLGPVHIGAGVKFNKMQYIYDYKQRRAYFLSEAAWMRLLVQKRLLDAYSTAMSKGAINDLYKWCVDNRLTPADIQLASTGWANVSVGTDRDLRFLNDVAPLIRGADGRPYIPGSSIKGALRTAVLHRLITENTGIDKRRYWQKLSALIDAKPPRAKLTKEVANLTKELETELLHCLALKDAKGRPVPLKDAVTSAMKGLRVSDAFCVQDGPTSLVRKVDWQDAPMPRDPEKLLPLCRECFPPGTVLTFSITVEPAITSAIGIASPGDVLADARRYAAHILALEQEAFGKRLPGFFSRYADAGLLLGGGAGFLDKTLLYSLAAPGEARALTAKLLDLLFAKVDKVKRISVPTHRHGALDTNLSPRTLKVGYFQNERHRVGVCRLEAISC